MTLCVCGEAIRHAYSRLHFEFDKNRQNSASQPERDGGFFPHELLQISDKAGK